MKILIGHTGFVGSNLQKQHKFDLLFNSKNIQNAYGTAPDLCVYSGVFSEKFKADSFPEDDLAHIQNALENIRLIKPKNLVLISTVDTIPNRQSVDIFEDTPFNTDDLTPYGRHRLLLENEVRTIYPSTLIVRLPGLFGEGLKKNFIYDMINLVPAMLRKIEPVLVPYYYEDETGFFRLKPDADRETLKGIFNELGFSALNFTDSRSKFAFYNLDYLWGHIQTLREKGVTLAHMAVEPVGAGELYKAIFGRDFINELDRPPFDYSFFKTRHWDEYIFNKGQIIEEIRRIVC